MAKEEKVSTLKLTGGYETAAFGTFSSYPFVATFGNTEFTDKIKEASEQRKKTGKATYTGILMSQFVQDVCDNSKKAKVLERSNHFFFDEENTAILQALSQGRQSIMTPDGRIIPSSLRPGGFTTAEYMLPDGLVLKLVVEYKENDKRSVYSKQPNKAYIYLRMSGKAAKNSIHTEVNGKKVILAEGRFFLLTKEQIMQEDAEGVGFAMLKYLDKESYKHFITVEELEAALYDTEAVKNIGVNFLGEEVVLQKRKIARKTL